MLQPFHTESLMATDTYLGSFPNKEIECATLLEDLLPSRRVSMDQVRAWTTTTTIVDRLSCCRRRFSSKGHVEAEWVVFVVKWL